MITNTIFTRPAFCARANRALLTGALLLMLSAGVVHADGFELGEDALGGYHGTRYVNKYTRVPTTGKLAAVKIADDGKTYYICKEKTGFVIYHVEIRPINQLKTKLDEEIETLTEKWDTLHKDELLFTKHRYEEEVNKIVQKYSEAVWIRNEIVLAPPKTEVPTKNALKSTKW